LLDVVLVVLLLVVPLLVLGDVTGVSLEVPGIGVGVAASGAAVCGDAVGS
jgi:type IV secretory pathway TrbL component